MHYTHAANAGRNGEYPIKGIDTVLVDSVTSADSTGRNGEYPIKGIDTPQPMLILLIFFTVEMENTRLRELTQFILVDSGGTLFGVEMENTRLRELTLNYPSIFG